MEKNKEPSESKMSKSRRGKSASTNEIGKWETELVQMPFSEVNDLFMVAL